MNTVENGKWKSILKKQNKTKAMKFSGNGHKCNKVDVPIIMENLMRMYLDISI